MRAHKSITGETHNSGLASFNGSLHGRHAASHSDSDETGIGVALFEQTNVRGFEHGVGGFESRDQTQSLHKSKCHHILNPPQVSA